MTDSWIVALLRTAGQALRAALAPQPASLPIPVRVRTDRGIRR